MANPPMTDNDIAAVVSAAVGGERERCARIAEGFLRNNTIQDTIGEAQHVTAKAIAKLIRLG